MKIRLARKIDKWVFAVEGCNFRMQSLYEEIDAEIERVKTIMSAQQPPNLFNQ